MVLLRVVGLLGLAIVLHNQALALDCEISGKEDCHPIQEVPKDPGYSKNRFDPKLKTIDPDEALVAPYEIKLLEQKYDEKPVEIIKMFKPDELKLKPDYFSHDKPKQAYLQIIRDSQNSFVVLESGRRADVEFVECVHSEFTKIRVKAKKGRNPGQVCDLGSQIVELREILSQLDATDSASQMDEQTKLNLYKLKLLSESRYGFPLRYQIAVLVDQIENQKQYRIENCGNSYFIAISEANETKTACEKAEEMVKTQLATLPDSSEGEAKTNLLPQLILFNLNQ